MVLMNMLFRCFLKISLTVSADDKKPPISSRVQSSSVVRVRRIPSIHIAKNLFFFLIFNSGHSKCKSSKSTCIRNIVELQYSKKDRVITDISSCILGEDKSPTIASAIRDIPIVPVSVFLENEILNIVL